MKHLNQEEGILQIPPLNQVTVVVPVMPKNHLTPPCSEVLSPISNASSNAKVNDDSSGTLTEKQVDGMEKMLLIAAAYSASIGGMCTLIGTPTNLVMKERADLAFESLNCTTPVTFTTWLVFGAPLGYTFIFFAWFWLQLFFLGPTYVYRTWIAIPIRSICRRSKQQTDEEDKAQMRLEKQNARVTAVITRLYEQLEPMGFQQYAVMVHCILLVLLLVTRQLSSGDSDDDYGWGNLVAPKFTKESTATVLVAASMFIFPSRLPDMSGQVPPPLLEWKQVDKSFPFGVILLLGGGMAAAYGAGEAGLPALIAPVFRDLLEEIPISLAVMVTSVMIATMTEFMSNVACVTLIAPIMEKLAFQLNVNPLLFLFPTTLSASFAFMLPVATPPNALVFSTNRLKIIDMVKCGSGMNILGIFVVFLATNTWGDAYFDLFNVPQPCTA